MKGTLLETFFTRSPHPWPMDHLSLKKLKELKAQAVQLYEQGKYPRAGELFSELRQRDPGDIDAYNFLGLIGLQTDDLPAAKEAYETALRLDTENADLWNNLGLVLCKMKLWPLAEKCMRAALKLAPHQVPSQFNLGRTLLSQSQFEEASALFAGLPKEYGANHEYQFMVGTCHLRLNRLEAAETALRRALELSPGLVEGYNNLGVTLRLQGKVGEAMALFEEALQLQESHPETHINRATLRLLQGDFAQGWSEFEYRFTSYRLLFGTEELTMERWNGEPMPGKTILLLAEQGLGDTLQFVRFAEQVRARCGRVILECQKNLARLLRGVAGIDQIILQGPSQPPRPPFDSWAPLLSLPRFFTPTLESIPAPVPYLGRSLPARVRPPGAPLRVGIVWAGSPTHAEDRVRSFPVEMFTSLRDLPGVELVSLQKFKGEDPVPGEIPFPNAVAGCRDFLDTARVVADLDLVISVDTAVAHLAGAMGKPLWLLLPCHAEWRWLLDRTDSPWYPTARLLRLARPGDWEELRERLARALVEAALLPTLAPAPVSIAPSS